MGARTAEMKGREREVQTSCTNMHKDNFGSQLNIFDTGAPSPERVDTDAIK